MTIVQVFALAFLIVSFILAVLDQPQLKSPLLWAVWAGVVLYVLGGVTGLGVRLI